MARPPDAYLEHKRIYDAIEDRDPEVAELMMRRHIARARVRRLEAMGFPDPATT